MLSYFFLEVKEMKTAIAQMYVQAGHIKENTENMLSMINEAREKGADMIIFPSMCVTGSMLGVLHHDDAYINTALKVNDMILEASEDIMVVYGNIDEIDREKPAVYVCADRKWIDNDFVLGGRSYVCVVEDELFDDNEADCIIHLDSSYYTGTENVVYNPGEIISVNSVGLENDGHNVFVKHGASKVYGPEGARIRLESDFTQKLFIFNDETQYICEEDPHQLLHTLIYALKEFDKQMFNGRMKWVIGLSGGLDSTINAALLTMALGKGRIVGYNMASYYNSDKTKNNARNLAHALGIEIREGSIEMISEATVKTMENYGYQGTENGLIFENIQARVRGHLLSTFAAAEGAVIINNGNKVECALGYCTLYGDEVGALCLIGDVTKVQLFELGHQINGIYGCEVIPENLLPVETEEGCVWDMAPSAELKDAQKDPMKWFYHDDVISGILDGTRPIEKLMEIWLSGEIYDTPLGKWVKFYGLDDPKVFMEDVHWVVNTMHRNAFKRFQAPPLLCISNGAIGVNYKESQLPFIPSDEFVELEKKILSL